MSEMVAPRLNRSWNVPAHHVWTIFLVVALFMQSFLLNTHIHQKPLSLHLPQSVFSDNAVEDHANFPAEDGQGSCPVCDQIVHAGQFVTPAARVHHAPAPTVSIIPIVTAAPVAIATPSFFWKGRAPPR